MYLRTNDVYVRLQDAERFLNTLYSDASPFPSPSHCRTRVYHGVFNEADKSSLVDVKWLPTFLLRYPGVDITFDGMISLWPGAMDLSTLVDVIKSNESAWRVALINVKSMSLWTPILGKEFENYPQWQLLLAIDERQTTMWPVGKTLSEKEIEDFMVGLGFQTENDDDDLWALMVVWFNRGPIIPQAHAFLLYS